jgi:hypothetical protein
VHDELIPANPCRIAYAGAVKRAKTHPPLDLRWSHIRTGRASDAG